jgi:SPP1 gp7 family putative phage head morphogenesis protein
MRTKRKPTQVPASLKNIDLGHVLRKVGIYEQREYYASVKEAAIPLAKHLIQSRKKVAKAEPQRHVYLNNDTVQAYMEKQIHVVDVAEKKFEARIQQFIQDVGQDFLKHLDAEVTNQKSFVAFINKDYFADYEDDLITQAVLDFTPLLESVSTIAGNNALALLRSSEPYINDTIREKVRANVEKFAKSMIDTDREHLANIITNGLQSGAGIPEIRGMIENDFNQYSKMQATRIARTEVLRTSTAASIDAWKDSGVVEGLQWLTYQPCPECEPYEGQIRSIDGAGFYDAVNEFQDGDPPLHPNCQCQLLPVVSGEKAYKPATRYERDTLKAHIAELEAQIDKRTKEYRDIKERRGEDEAYIKELEDILDARRSDEEAE